MLNSFRAVLVLGTFSVVGSFGLLNSQQIPETGEVAQSYSLGSAVEVRQVEVYTCEPLFYGEINVCPVDTVRTFSHFKNIYTLSCNQDGTSCTA